VKDRCKCKDDASSASVTETKTKTPVLPSVKDQDLKTMLQSLILHVNTLLGTQAKMLKSQLSTQKQMAIMATELEALTKAQALVWL